MNILVQPSEHMGGYSSIPVRVNDPSNVTDEDYKYLINILWNKVTFSSITDAYVNGKVVTVLECDSPHSFKKGETVFINDSSNGDEYSGYYNITSVPDNTRITLDELFTTPFGSNPSVVSRVIKYKLSPDLESEAKIDMSNTIKDFVTQNLEDNNVPYEGDNTVFEYDLSIGHESRLLWDFDDNYFVGGNIGFIYTGTTNISDVPFNIGDSIYVQQMIEAWSYDDNFFSAGNIGFTGSTSHNFIAGNTIEVVGQITNPQYNGFTTVTSVPDSQSVVTEVGFGLNTPPEGGTIYGFSRPSYNGVCTVTDIITGTTGFGDGVVVVTDKGFVANTSAIPGTIRYADNRLTTIHNEIVIEGLKSYNAHINRLDYTVDAYEPYYIDPVNCSQLITGSSENFLSTILEHNNTKNKYRIETSSKSYLLTHIGTGVTQNGLGYDFYNSSNQLIGQILYTGTTYEDMYSPVGLEQIGSDISSYFQVTGLTGGDFTSYSGSVDNYSVYVGDICSNLCCCDANISWEYKPSFGGGSDSDVGVLQDGLINGNPYWYFTISGSPAQLVYFPAGVDDGWYITEQGPTEFSAVTTFYAFDKNNDTNCPDIDTSAWSTPIPSIIETSTVNVTITDNGVKNVSEKVWFEINDDCSYYDMYHLMWKDRYGSWLSYPFIYFSKDSTEVERKTYYQTEGNWNNNTFGYETYGRGERSYFGRSRDKVLLNSGWVDDYENLLMKDLMESTSVYIQTPDNVLIGCIIEEKQIELKKGIQDKIYNYTFSVRLSNNEVRF